MIVGVCESYSVFKIHRFISGCCGGGFRVFFKGSFERIALAFLVCTVFFANFFVTKPLLEKDQNIDWLTSGCTVNLTHLGMVLVKSKIYAHSKKECES